MPPIIVTSTIKKGPQAAAMCVRSVRAQWHKDWRLHYYVAGADPETVQAAKTAAGGDPRVNIIEDRDGRTVCGNLHSDWAHLADGVIIVWLDGDDYLAVPQALEIIAKAHEEGAWVTYGSFIHVSGEMGFASPTGWPPRQHHWTATHLRSFRAGLVKRMRHEDWLEPNGEFANNVNDQRIMLAVLEMAGPKRSWHIKNVLCVYDGRRWYTGMSDAEREEENQEVYRIRSWEPYKVLPEGIF